MKSDRKRLKAEKVELLHQMKQLYTTLEDKETELRDFIRNYEHRVKESDESIKQVTGWMDGSLPCGLYSPHVTHVFSMVVFVSYLHVCERSFVIDCLPRCVCARPPLFFYCSLLSCLLVVFSRPSVCLSCFNAVCSCLRLLVYNLNSIDLFIFYFSYFL